MSREEEKITYFAFTDHRGKQQKFGIKALDRLKHVYVIGKTGMGKSVLLENLAAQDIQNGNGLAFIDPHGSAADTLLDYVPKERLHDVVYFAPFDMEYPVSFNVMEDVGYDKRHLVVSGLISTFKKIWPDVWSARMEYILTNTLFALLEYPDATLLDVNRMLVNKEFRKDVVVHITDPIVKAFWVEEFATYTDRYTQEATPAIQNKIGQFISNPLIRNIIGQPKSSFNFREAMDGKKIFIMNLAKGRIGDVNARLIGSMLIIKIYLAAMSRADVSSAELAKLPPFYFFVDEFQSFANETFADILSESRKYKLSLTLAHQYIFQMPEEVQKAVFGNVGTMVLFRVGGEDATALETEFMPVFTPEDLVNLGNYQIYLKLMIDGLTSRPFSAHTLPPIELPKETLRDEAIEQSRKTYAKPRVIVEEAILKRHLPVPKPQVPRSPGNFSQGTPRDSSKNFEREPIGPRSNTHVTQAPRPSFEKPVFSERSNVRKDYPRRSEWPRDERKDERIISPRAHRTFEERTPADIRHGRQEEERPGERQEMSLKTLLPGTKRGPDKDSKNLKELRSILQEALKEKANSQQPIVNSQQPTTNNRQQNEKEIPEIPEEKLRDVFKEEQ